MKRKVFITLLLACCFVACLAAVTNISGNWTTIMKPGDGSQFTVTYTFKADGDKFTGNIVFPNKNNFAIADGVIAGDSIHFNVNVNGRSIPNAGKLYTDSIGLDIIMMGQKYHNTLLRAK